MVNENKKYAIIYKCQNCNNNIRHGFNGRNFDSSISGIIDSFIQSDKDFAAYSSFVAGYKYYYLHKCNDGSIGFAIPIKISEVLD